MTISSDRLIAIRAALADGGPQPWRVIVTDLLDAYETERAVTDSYTALIAAERAKRELADSILRSHLRIGHDSRHGEYFYCPQIHDLTDEQRVYLERLGDE